MVPKVLAMSLRQHQALRPAGDLCWSTCVSPAGLRIPLGLDSRGQRKAHSAHKDTEQPHTFPYNLYRTPLPKRQQRIINPFQTAPTLLGTNYQELVRHIFCTVVLQRLSSRSRSDKTSPSTLGNLQRRTYLTGVGLGFRNRGNYHPGRVLR